MHDRLPCPVRENDGASRASASEDGRPLRVETGPEIEVFADTICPWCYIGKKRLARALAERDKANPGAAAPRIKWRAFQLNPAMPKEGMERSRYLAAKFGGQDAAQRVYGAIGRAATAEGLSLAFAKIERTPNTIDSHRLIRLAEAAGMQDAAIEAIFSAYFVEGADIGSRSVLVGIAATLGLAAAETHRFLEGRDGLRDIFEDEQRGRRLGITGVPFYLFDSRYAIAGVQPPEVLHQISTLCT